MHWLEKMVWENAHYESGMHSVSGFQRIRYSIDWDAFFDKDQKMGCRGQGRGKLGKADV